MTEQQQHTKRRGYSLRSERLVSAQCHAAEAQRAGGGGGITGVVTGCVVDTVAEAVAWLSEYAQAHDYVAVDLLVECEVTHYDEAGVCTSRVCTARTVQFYRKDVPPRVVVDEQ